MSEIPSSDYMSNEACEFIRKIVPKESWHELFIVIDGEIEAQLEDCPDCDSCDQRIPDEPRYNEGYC